MEQYSQENRNLAVRTPLGEDALLLVGFSGHEALSQPFHFQLDLIAENIREIPFAKLLGQPITVQLRLAQGGSRYFHGICTRLLQGKRDMLFTAYEMEILPQFWLLSKRAQSRIFQNLSIPEILKKVLTGLDVSFQLQGTYYPRDYCAQYRETDFNFASRLMEEEGIYYSFKHTAERHQMVLTDSPYQYPDLPQPSTLYYEDVLGGRREAERIYDWSKAQELTPGKYTLWDYCFELSRQNLAATKMIQEEIQAGSVRHSLRLAGNEKLEIYDWPGEYAQRFDGVDRAGGDRAADLAKIFQDNQRTVEIRMQQEAASAIEIHGAGDCRHLAPGYKFTLATLQEKSPITGTYLLTSVVHTAGPESYRSSGDAAAFTYHNSFTCLPVGLPFRPPRVTPKPTVTGSQTAVVVGPPGEEIFTDKYGRVKVQFHWDREGKDDAASSCWVRVATLAAGQQWGFVHVPRIGEEVIVDFLESDPDRPLIIGSVYNAQMMPPYKLPDNRTQSGFKTRSTPNGSAANFNELRFEDKKGAEHVYFHAEKDFQRTVENNDMLLVGHNRSIVISKGNLLTRVPRGQIETEALQALELRVGQNSIRMDQSGISIQGLNVQIAGEVQTQVQGLVTQVTGDALLKVNGTPVANGKAGPASNPIQNLVQQVVNEAVGKLAAAAVGGHGAPDLVHQVMQNAVGQLAGAILPGGKAGSPAAAFQGLINQVVQEAVGKLTSALHPGGPSNLGKTPLPPGVPAPAGKLAKETRRSS